MDILYLCNIISLGIAIIVVLISKEAFGNNNIFDIMISAQPQECQSFVNPNRTSISDPDFKYPPWISDKVNYEYVVTTPNYPNKYPLNLKCVLLIKAPAEDFQIILEVREKFDVEPSRECNNDFLEVVDGPFGFSQLLGRYCQSKSVEEIRSSGPFLWLRFVSDGSLPHTGFKLVYRFTQVKLPVQRSSYCYKQTQIPADGAFVFNTSFLLTEMKAAPETQNNALVPTECVFDFYVNPKFTTFVHQIAFKKHKDAPACSSSFLEIYHRDSYDNKDTQSRIKNYYRICKKHDFVQRHFTDSSRTLFRMVTTDLRKINKFVYVITPVKAVEVSGTCGTNYFECSNQLCISQNLVCNQDWNCQNGTDENNCHGGKMAQKKNETITDDPVTIKRKKEHDHKLEEIRVTNRNHGIILGSISSVLLICVIVCFMITIHSKRKDSSKGANSLPNVSHSFIDQSQNKRLYYEQLQSSEPSVVALSTDKMSRKNYGDNSIWSKRTPNDISFTSSIPQSNSILKLNGGIGLDSANRNAATKQTRIKKEKKKNKSMNKIGKYLSEPNPPRTENSGNQTMPNHNSDSHHKLSLLHEDFPSNIQRASSMGSGLRKILEPANDANVPENIEWYCGPVIRGPSLGNFQLNCSSEVLNSKPGHVPGCRSLPNVNNVGLTNPVYYTKPPPLLSPPILNPYQETDITEDDDNSSCGDDDVSSVRNYISKDFAHTSDFFDPHQTSDSVNSPAYGFKYFCTHEPSLSSDFVEYIA